MTQTDGEARPRLRTIFFGTPRFAATVLASLLEAGMAPAAVVCNPDRPVGRKRIVTPPPVKVLAEAHGVPVLQPEALDDAFAARLRGLDPDCFIVAAYAKIIPQEFLAIPRLGAIGVHPSLLPKYRGASPIQSAILAGERETGVTLYRMDAKMDHGPVLVHSTIPIAEYDTYLMLEAHLAAEAGTLLVATLPDIAADTLRGIPQDDATATFTKKFSTQDGFIPDTMLAAAERGENAATVLRKILAFTPEPGAWTLRNGARIKLLEAVLEPNGSLRLTLVQKEGERPRRLM
jgi:methionyl-tRNA formyltransferase